MAKKKAEDVRIKKKKWVQIISPTFNDHVVGETSVMDSKAALGKVVKINLMNLVNDPRKQSIDISFKVDQIKGETGVIAQVQGFEYQQPALRKLVRRGKTKITDSFKCMTGDKKPVIIKLFMITRFRVNNSIATRIRQSIKQQIVNKISTLSFENLILETVSQRLQKEMRKKADKIYPLRMVELSTIKILESAKGNFLKPVFGEEAEIKPLKKEKKTRNNGDRPREKASEPAEKTDDEEAKVKKAAPEKTEAKKQVAQEEPKEKIEPVAEGSPEDSEDF